MRPFLSYVAEDILKKYGDNLSAITVVFPNKRASLFLNQELAVLSGRPVWSPNYITISELFRQYSSLAVADPLKAIIELHKSFTSITRKAETIDQFFGWGQLLLADFDDIDKYLVDVSAGYNGSENFAPGKTRYGFFPSASVGWVISEEKFMKRVGFVDFLKIRGSIGLVGNDQGQSTRFMYMEGTWNEEGSYYFGTNNSGGVPRYELGTPGNLGITWEKALKSNIGLDMDLFGKRLHFSGDIFNERRTNILVKPNSLPGVIAFTPQNMNRGEVNNSGYEVELGWRDHIGDLNYSRNAAFKPRSDFRFAYRVGAKILRNRMVQ